MCGICGFYTNDRQTDGETISRMNHTLLHRGPDDSGEEVFRTGEHTVALGQCRLSILDLSDLGHQPMFSADRRICVTFNGEIYNFKELKRELDYPFRSNCDTEVILAAYQRWGTDAFQRFNGMFACAIYDRESKELILARDRMGKKPLYYWLSPNTLVFASELKSIMQYPGFPKNIRIDILNRYLVNQCIAGPDSIFQDVYKLMPGTFMRYQNGRTETEVYWDLLEEYEEGTRHLISDYGEARRTLRQQLLQAAGRRLISDVPVGTFLSGGYDSSLITALVQSIRREPVKTYSIGFENSAYDEAPYARMVAEHLHTDHTEHYVTNREMLEMVKSIPYYYDEPFADASQIPTMLVSEIAKHDVSVVLTGDGGDELFCGYSRYDAIRNGQRYDRLGAILYRTLNTSFGKDHHLMEKLPRRVGTVVMGQRDPARVQPEKIRKEEFARRLLLEPGLPAKYPEDHLTQKNWQIRGMLLDLQYYLVDNVLCKVDRGSMKYALECRSPLLDVNVIRTSFRIPHEFKYQPGEKKRILKSLTYEYIPRELLERPKRGFGAPVGDWMRNELKEELMEMSRRSYLNRQGIFIPERMEKMADDFVGKADADGAYEISSVLWSFFCFQKWYELFLS